MSIKQKAFPKITLPSVNSLAKKRRRRKKLTLPVKIYSFVTSVEI